MVIEDGKGTKQKAKVDKQNRLHTNAVTFTEFQAAVLNGDGYNISTGVINLTSGSESALWYLKNNTNIPIVIKEILVIPQDSAGGTGNAVIRIYRNPKTGTIIDNSLAVETLANRNFGSERPLDATTYKGVEGDTITGDTFAVSSRSVFDTPIAFDAEIIVLENSNTIAVSFQPPSGNTSQNVVIACTLIEERIDFNGGLNVK